MISRKSIIYFRVDGDETIGLGHLFRCKAFAEVLGSHYECRLISRALSQRLKEQLAGSFLEISILPENAVENECIYFQEIIGKEDLIILDGYHFDTSYQEALKTEGYDFFCILSWTFLRASGSSLSRSS